MGNAIIEQKSQQWHSQRKMRITGSRVGAILGLSKWQTPDDVLREMVRDYHGAEREFSGNIATEHGQNHETRALLCFMRKTGLQVEQCGFFEYGDRMGASPDGLTSDGGVLELKVPYGLRNGGDFKPLAEQPHYAAQVQMEMLATGRKHAYFAQYIAPKGDPLDFDAVKESIHIERVDFDEGWLDANHPALDAFYQRLLAELDNPAHLEPLRVEVDTLDAQALLDEIDRLRQRQKEAAEAEKMALDNLVELVGGKDATVCGRKLTLVKRDGAISYSKAIKELLPDADLEKWRGKPSESWRLT